MADLFPKSPKLIRQRIRRYERQLENELKTGHGSDGYGKRYLLGPLYLLVGDVDGALESFEWYENAYPDDTGEPYQYLTWALALRKGGFERAARNKLYQTILENLYLVPHLLGKNPKRLDIWHGSNLAEIEYAMDTPDALLDLWDDEACEWARVVSEHPNVVEKITRYIDIQRELKTERPGPKRSALVAESFALPHQQLPNF